jgi:hypothetical protein
VHCQAGVGRTGIFLAVFLMQKYGWGAVKALYELRRVRPSSCQFSHAHYGIDPFELTSDFYRCRNQERFLEQWNVRRGNLEDVEVGVGLATELAPEELAKLDAGIARRERWIAAIPRAMCNPYINYDCYICNGIQSIGPYVTTSDTIHIPRN